MSVAKITYKKASEVSLELLYTTFSEGFSDYIFPMKISFEAFVERFFSVDGNILDASYIALDGEKGVGVIFSGIRPLDGINTLRCGALSVAPDYRKMGIAKNLLDLHIQAGKKYKVEQIMLECIKGNDNAISFYEKHGYKAKYDWVLYMRDDVVKKYQNDKYITDIINEELQSYYRKNINTHFSWGNSFETIQSTKDVTLLGYKESDEIVGIIAFDVNKILSLHVSNSSRRKGIATNLLKEMDLISPSKKYFMFSFNLDLMKTLEKNNYSKNEMEQFEFYLTK